MRGKYHVKEDKETESDSDDESDTNDLPSTHPMSKEARIAEIYRKKLYHPIIAHIRKTQYGWNGDLESIPDYLRVIS